MPTPDLRRPEHSQNSSTRYWKTLIAAARAAACAAPRPVAPGSWLSSQRRIWTAVSYAPRSSAEE